MTGLRGCFAYVHIADPENGVYESNEDNNEAQVIVRLPFRLGERRRGCRGRDRGQVPRPAAVPGLASARRAEALGAHPLGLEAGLEQQRAGGLDEPVRPADEGGAAAQVRLAAISAASMRPVWPVQPAGGSRVKVSAASSPSSSA